MTDELVRKLSKVLRQKVNTEMQVVYLLVELRKLMDRDKQPNRTIRSYCNWVVHIDLSYPSDGSAELLQEFDAALRLEIEENAMPADFPKHYSFQVFRTKLRKLLKHYSLPTELTDSDDAWITFSRLYSAIVSDCPIVMSASKRQLKYVEKIELTTRPSMSSINGIPVPSLQWLVMLKDGGVRQWGVMLG